MNIGSKVIKVRDYRPGGRFMLGFGEVSRVMFHYIVLADGTRWRRRDGFTVGAARARGIGLEGERIVEDTPDNRAACVNKKGDAS